MNFTERKNVKVLRLPKECNVLTGELLKKIYLSSDYNNYVNTLYQQFETKPLNLFNTLSNNLIGVLNIILIDNITKVVVNKDPISLVTAISNEVLPLSFEIGYRHYFKLIGEEESQDEDGLLNQTLAIKTLNGIIADIYLKHKEEFNRAAMEMFDNLYSCLGFFNIKWFSGTLFGDGNPGLFITENTHENSHAY